jgi:hypothetical protein
MNEWIYDIQACEAAEVAIRRPQFTHSVLTAKRSNPRVVNAPARHSTCRQQDAQIGPMLLRFCEQHQGW